MKRKKVCVMVVAIVAALATTFVICMDKREEKTYGILLSFDDYAVDSWENSLDLLDEHDVDVTFFVNVSKPSGFCYEAKARGHEIGYHTRNHTRLTELSKQEFYEETVADIENFREEGFELTSFAYPYGAYEDWMNVELLKYYDTVRGAWVFKGYNRESVSEGFVESGSLDNLHFESDEDFRREIQKMLDDLLECEQGTVASLYSHAIDYGDWCISPERLEILFQEAEKRGIEFYTFHELQ